MHYQTHTDLLLSTTISLLWQDWGQLCFFFYEISVLQRHEKDDDDALQILIISFTTTYLLIFSSFLIFFFLFQIFFLSLFEYFYTLHSRLNLYIRKTFLFNLFTYTHTNSHIHKYLIYSLTH